MARHFIAMVLSAALSGAMLAGTAYARSGGSSESFTPIAEASPTLAPFQHVKFCLRYPSECKSNPAESNRIDLTPQNSELLHRVNHQVNAEISPMIKTRGPELDAGWTISPAAGDCNDYAVTKRHELLRKGLPAKALRLSVVKTPSGIGHLVLVVATTSGDIVLDNLRESVLPWQQTDYRWLKIQSASDARFWYEIKVRNISTSRAARKIHVANR
ncbi:MAG: transglutaminase-like cysteine peptidase [Rhizobiales bacterium]|nr:transglutaminase-like cysteine peptidase [Hyphomicrobiales bacterium]